MTEYIVELNDNVVSGNKFLLGTVYLDVEPIVRCRDCEHRTHKLYGIPAERVMVCQRDGFPVQPYKFCA